MAKPMAVIGFSYFLAMALGAFLRSELCYALALLFLLVGAVTFFVLKGKKHFLPFIFLSFAAALMVMGIYLSVNYYPALALSGQKAELSGTVTQIESAKGEHRFTIKVKSINLEAPPKSLKVILSSYGNVDLNLYDDISCTASLYSFGEESTLSDTLYYRSGGVTLYGSIVGECFSSTPQKYPLAYYLAVLRSNINDSLTTLLPGWRGETLSRMLIGIKSGPDRSVVSDFRFAGMSHILAVSGLHMVVITGALEALLKRLKMAEAPRGIICALCAVFYMFVAGLSFSVIRSGIMVVLRFIGQTFDKRASSLNSLGTAIFIILLADPLSAVDIGFILSVVGTLSLIVPAAKLNDYIMERLEGKKLPKFVGGVVQSFSVALCAWCCTLPVSAFVFGEVSTLSVFANIISAPLASLTIIFGILTVTFSLLGIAPLYNAFGLLAGIFVSILRGIAGFFASLPFSVLPFSSSWLLLWLLGALLLVGLPIILGKKAKYLKISLLLSLVALLSGLLSGEVINRNTATLSVRGDDKASVISLNKGGKAIVLSYGLNDENIYLLRDILSPLTTDVTAAVSLSGLPTGELRFVKEYSPTFMLMGEGASIRYDKGESFTPGVITLSDKAYIDVISENVAILEYEGFTLLYILGEYDIMTLDANYRRPDIALLLGDKPLHMEALGCKYLLTSNRTDFTGANETLILGEGRDFFIRGGEISKGG